MVDDRRLPRVSLNQRLLHYLAYCREKSSNSATESISGRKNFHAVYKTWHFSDKFTRTVYQIAHWTSIS